MSFKSFVGSIILIMIFLLGVGLLDFIEMDSQLRTCIAVILGTIVGSLVEMWYHKYRQFRIKRREERFRCSDENRRHKY